MAQAYLAQRGEPETIEKVRRRVRWITSQVRGPRVLDIGTGEGILPILLGREGFHVVGIDARAEAIDYARRRLEQESKAVQERVQLRNGSLFESGRGLTFDSVIMGGVIGQVSNADYFVQNAVRNLDPEGLLIATLPFGLHPDDEQKHSFFLSDIQRLFAARGRIEHLSVVDGYIRLVLRNGPAEHEKGEPAGLLPSELLTLTEEATLALQGAVRQQLGVASRELETLNREVGEARHRLTLLHQERQEKNAALEAAAQELQHVQERFGSVEAELDERRREVEALKIALERQAEDGRLRLAEATELKSLVTVKEKALASAQQQAAEQAEQLNTLARDLDIARSRLVTAREPVAVLEEKLGAQEKQIEELDRKTAQLSKQLQSERSALQEAKEQHADLSRALRANKAKVAAEAERIKNHLSYRFGREIVQCRASPWAWAMLPFRLKKAYRAYRLAMQEKTDREQETQPAAVPAEVVQAENATSPEEIFSLEGTEELRRSPIAEASKALSQPLAIPLVESSASTAVDVSRVDYTTASQWFYREGRLTDTLRALESLQERGLKFDKPKRDFKGFVEGLVRLKAGWTLPPHQPNPGLMTRPQQLLYCLHQSVPHATNGYSTRSHGVAVGLQQAGWKVRATTRPGFPWDIGVKGLSKGYHEAEVDGVTYATVAGWNLAKTPLDYYLAEAADHYLREAQNSGAEVITAASNHITALPALTAARRLGLPFVYEVRGLWETTQASTQPEWADSERYKLMRRLEQQAAREADLVITLTEELADELSSWGVARERIAIVPNAVNAERFSPRAPDSAVARELDLRPGVPVIGYAGSAVAYEGLELLMDALAQLKKSGQEFIFVLVGDGKVIDRVKERAGALGLEQQCRFTGRVPFDEVPRYLSCMDIMPVPRLSSAVTEMVSPLKPLEAMAMGKAVVLSDVSPHKTMAGTEERARLFAKGSAEALCTVLQELIARPEERARLGQAARTWIEQERTWNHVAGIYDGALQALRARRPAPSTADTQIKQLEQITLGLIADRFTSDTLESAVKLVKLSPEAWQEELASQPIDALLVESAWKGNDGQWHRKVGYYSDEEFAPLRGLLDHCRHQGIPTLFWNKEDPIHFERFRKTASLCDHVFTTDSRRIIPYLATPGARTRTASSCPFYASRQIHNLLPSTRAWQPTAAYGGTYYGQRYAERSEYLDKIMSAAAPLGLTIYDRQHNDPDSPYKYPSGLAGYVAGGLSYREMIQAYKAHPVQINVNSVLDSPTMFSRRVMEAAACGAAIISSPGLGMNRYLDGAVQIVRSESEAAQALENLLHHPAYRWRQALKGARTVMRAHTTRHRITQMLRTAGLAVAGPDRPVISLVTREVSEAAARCLLDQTLRPRRVVASAWQPAIQAQLRAAGIECLSGEAQAAADSLWLLAESVAIETLESEDLEDLAWVASYAPQRRLGFSREMQLTEGQWPGVAFDSRSIDPGLQLLRPSVKMKSQALGDWAQQQPALALRKPPQLHEKAPNVMPQKTVVIAGHDLKFIKAFYPYFTQAGIRILLDFWQGHNKHDEQASRRLLLQADTVFCEWMLGNAIWYAKHKREDQRLIGRLHLQEIDHALFPKLRFEVFNKVIFVAPHILRQAVTKNRALKRNGVVVYNGVDVEALQSVPRKTTNRKVLGFVGMVPQRKRIDLALDILRDLRKQDAAYSLHIKGKRPEDYPWMANRKDEMAWYEQQYRRLQEDPLLKGAVFFDPHGNDMPEWYAGIDYILSTSDFESFHFSVADGAAAGCKPIILPWEGSKEIYPKNWIADDVDGAVSAILNTCAKIPDARSHVRARFDIKLISQEILKLI